MTSQKLNEEHEILRRFMAVVVSSAFWASLRNGNVQANVRANTSGQFEGTAHEDVGFRGEKGQKVHPNFAPNIAVEFH